MSKFKMPTRDVESWVTGDQTSAAAIEASQKAPARSTNGKVARLTIDLPPELHARFKSVCALKGTRMVEEVSRFIEEWTQKNS